MKTATLKELKSALQDLSEPELLAVCLRLARYRSDNKELLTYLLYEAANESDYASSVKDEIDREFEQLPAGNVYYIKKTLRKILRFVNRHIRYSGIAITEIELRIHFCRKMKEARIPMHTGTVLHNIFQQQIMRIKKLLASLPDDVRTDYDGDMRFLTGIPVA